VCWGVVPTTVTVVPAVRSSLTEKWPEVVAVLNDIDVIRPPPEGTVYDGPVPQNRVLVGQAFVPWLVDPSVEAVAGDAFTSRSIRAGSPIQVHLFMCAPLDSATARYLPCFFFFFFFLPVTLM